MPGILARRARRGRDDARSSAPTMRTPILASMMFGGHVAIDGGTERVKDLGVVKENGSWRVVAVRTHRRDAKLTGWSSDGGMKATAAGGPIEATWVREALFDRQIVDLDGRRVIRIGDVVLDGHDGLLEVTAVEVGAAAVLRRLGWVRLAARFAPQLLQIDRLHVPNEAAGGLLLDAPREQLEQLDQATVTSLLSRLPVPVAEHAVRQSRHRGAVADEARTRRRRHRFPRSPR
jgi:hypothetical protein